MENMSTIIRELLLRYALDNHKPVVPLPHSDEDWHSIESICSIVGYEQKTLQNKVSEAKRDGFEITSYLGRFYRYSELLKVITNAEEAKPEKGKRRRKHIPKE